VLQDVEEEGLLKLPENDGDKDVGSTRPVDKSEDSGGSAVVIVSSVVYVSTIVVPYAPESVNVPTTGVMITEGDGVGEELEVGVTSTVTSVVTTMTVELSGPSGTVWVKVTSETATVDSSRPP